MNSETLDRSAATTHPSTLIHAANSWSPGSPSRRSKRASAKRLGKPKDCAASTVAPTLALPQADNIHNGLRRTGNVREGGMKVVLESAGDLDQQEPRRD